VALDADQSIGKKTMPITKRQIAVLHVLKQQAGFGEDEYRDTLFRVAGVRSAKDLDQTGFEKVLEWFEALGYRTPRKPNRVNFGQRPGYATQKQLDFIGDLRPKAFDHDTDQGFSHWLERFFHVSHPRFLSVKAAGSVIEALKAMDQRKK
jgi:hypothetical protein